MCVIDLSFSLKASLRCGISVLGSHFLCYPWLSLASFTFGFVHQLKIQNVLVMENTFHNGLDGTKILYTKLACFVTD